MAVAHVACPGLVDARPYRVDVETVSELTRGRTVVDLHGVSGVPANAQVGLSIDQGAFAELLHAAIAKLPLTGFRRPAACGVRWPCSGP